ncbi:DNA glycosylase [Mycena pura]|uniref:Endonuclease III homolog n=1 Tax=Mycena pura TaxID=153505 RepID=A0AAD6VV05_9AGAR|nr:DNA glycosylase [Mycena pura]
MPGLRRTSTRLSSRVSPYNSGVTLYKVEEDATRPPATPRRQTRVKIELEEVQAEPFPSLSPDAPEKSSEEPTKSLSRKSSSPKKVTPHKKALETPHPAPARWREMYDAIKTMRSEIDAPVDTMGCQMAQRHETDPKVRLFITLVSLILSPQTTDKVVDAAVITLRTALGGSVSLDAVLAADPIVISDAINKVGMWRAKTKYLKASAEKLRDDFDGDVPQTIEDLLTLPGVGPKVGFLVLQSAWNINDGIGVDVHVHRITGLLGWHNAKTPEDARISLESWLPKELHREINPLLVGFGQEICKKKPLCGKCTLATSKLCPSAKLPKW